MRGGKTCDNCTNGKVYIGCPTCQGSGTVPDK